jgi:sulfur-carrier protein adenylyltransferase/sulfurtransferase
MFDYQKAYSRNIGWVTETEQEILRGKRIAIAGMGGVGGGHLLTLTRLGIGKFNIADFDSFEIHNFNRQAGAMMSTLDRPKVEVMAEMALDINPELQVSQFINGVTEQNLDDFLAGVDLYVDSLDFFALAARQMVFDACYARGIPAVTAAPLGMGAALLIFMPGEMSFEDYFRMEGHTEDEQALRFMLGLAPARLQLPYLVDDSRVDFNAKKGPSTPMACELCAGFAGTYALKILLNRGDVPIAPRGIHFDAYRNKLSTTWRPWGNNNPIQRLGLVIARKMVMAKKAPATKAELFERPVERILDLARWAPSGDNEQPWKFEIVDDSQLVVHATDTRDWCVYDLDGSSSQIALGALLENIEIAATAEGMAVRCSRRPGTPDTDLKIDIHLEPVEDTQDHPLLPFLKARVTQRRPLSVRALSVGQKRALELAVGEGYRVIWLEGRSLRWRVAKLLFHNAHIRLTIPEAYETHRKNIEWGVKFSEDRIPEYAVGVDYLSGRIMRWALQSWQRVKRLNRFMAGTWLPRLQMDLNAGLRCGAHFVIIADQPLSTVDDYVAGGRAMQRFWLEATRQGLQFQPEMTPLIFSRYVAQGVPFTVEGSEQLLAVRLAGELDDLLGPDQEPARRVYMGRVGFGDTPQSRSIRPPLHKLLLTKES